MDYRKSHIRLQIVTSLDGKHCHTDCKNLEREPNGWVCTGLHDRITGPAYFPGEAFLEPGSIPVLDRFPACLAQEDPPYKPPCHLELKLLGADEFCRDPDCAQLASLHRNWTGPGSGRR